MATSIAEITGFLQTAKLRFREKDQNTLVVPMETKTFRDRAGHNVLFVFVKLSEDGEYLTVFTPMAFELKGEFTQQFLTACAMVQWKTKLIQFEYDASDGEVRPVIEFPLEDAKLTSRQLLRCVNGLVRLVDDCFPILDRVRKDGVIEFPESDLEDMSELVERLARTMPAEVLGEALRRALAMKRQPIVS